MFSFSYILLYLIDKLYQINKYNTRKKNVFQHSKIVSPDLILFSLFTDTLTL